MGAPDGVDAFPIEYGDIPASYVIVVDLHPGMESQIWPPWLEIHINLRVDT